MRYRPPKTSQRSIRNMNTFYAGGVEMEQGTRRGTQPEAETNKAVAGWRNLKPQLPLERNKRRLATPQGHNEPVMLGWLAEGSPDWVGYLTTTITQSMVGKRVAVFVGLEAKRPDGTGRVSKEQEAFLNALTDAGGVSGVVCNADDCEAALARWLEKQMGDAR